MTIEERKRRQKERYRKKHPLKPKAYPNEKDRNLMVEKIVHPIIDTSHVSETCVPEERAKIESQNAAYYQKELKCRWHKDNKPTSIIIVEAGSMPAKGTTTYTAECYLKTPYDDELREYYKTICKEIIK